MSDNLLEVLGERLSAEESSVGELVRSLLKVAVAEFGFTTASVSRLDNENCCLRYWESIHGEAPQQTVFPLSGSALEKVFLADGKTVALHSSFRPFTFHPLYSRTTPVSLIGGMVGNKDSQCYLVDFTFAMERGVALSGSEMSMIQIIVGLIGRLLSLDDVTAQLASEHEERLAEAAASKKSLESLKHLELLVKNIAHEYNNTLVAIMGSAELALLDLPENTELQRRLLIIQRSAERAAELTDRLTAYSGDVEPEFRPVSLVTLVRQTLSDLRKDAPPAVRLEFQEISHLPSVFIDEKMVRRAVRHVIQGAIDAFDAREGIVSVFADKVLFSQEDMSVGGFARSVDDGEYVIIKISDNSEGLNREQLESVYDMLVATGGKTSGRQLGEVLEIVSNHGGMMEVSSSLGVGTTVKMVLPVKRFADDDMGFGQEAGSSTVTSSGASLGASIERGMILVVDDETNVREIAEEVLRKNGYTTLQASSGREAIELFQANSDQIVLVVLDVTMADMSGADVFEHLKRISPMIQVIMASGHHRGSVSPLIAGKYRPEFIHKPYSAREILEKVQMMLSRGNVGGRKKS